MSTRAEALHAVEREVGVLVRRVRRVIGVRSRAVHPQLQPATYLLLSHLDEAGPTRPSTVVGELGIDKAAVSRQLQQLVDLGLLQRVKDPEDGRATLVSVTEDAHRRLARVRAERSARFDRRLAGWSTAELAEFAQRLNRYNEAQDERRDG